MDKEVPCGLIATDESSGWAWQDTPETRHPGPSQITYQNGVRSDVQAGGYWEVCHFTVPSDILDERVKLLADKYQRKFGDFLEGKGLTIHRMTEPVLDRRPMPVPAGRRRYILAAWVSRRPRIVRFHIPDRFVPEFLKMGLKLEG